MRKRDIHRVLMLAKSLVLSPSEKAAAIKAKLNKIYKRYGLA